MSRGRRNARDETSMNLFPFLAVLICTMGSLIVLLVVMVQQARVRANTPLSTAEPTKSDLSNALAADQERDREEQAQLVMERQQQIEDYRWQAELLRQSYHAAAEQLAEQRLEAMRAAGMLPDAAQTEKPKKVVYGNKKKGKGKDNQASQQAEEVQATESKDAEPEEKAEDKKEEKPAEDDAGDDWDKDSSGDEWDAGDSDDDKFDDLADRLKKVATDDDVEDLIEVEKKKEQERLRELGLRRAEQERIEAEKLAKIQAEQEEANLKLQMAAQKREEGKKICVEIIQQVREIEGVSGVHVMAYRQEELVAEIIEEAGLLPRPMQAGFNGGQEKARPRNRKSNR